MQYGPCAMLQICIAVERTRAKVSSMMPDSETHSVSRRPDLLISLEGVEQVALEVVQLGHITVQLTHSVDQGSLLVAQPVSLILHCLHLQVNHCRCRHGISLGQHRESCISAIAEDPQDCSQLRNCCCTCCIIDLAGLAASAG